MVGAGIVGAATAARLGELQPGKRILLIEKEDGRLPPNRPEQRCCPYRRVPLCLLN
ncbi:NAD(P)-binding protein [Phaeobacter inhibens]|uniref:NAD(P)-binding protein n=1 Tax=Phaeobacter inhibens TaxID=221822 RepID=UPI00295F25E5|nr:NAD(P)-binding protein [Phaeobacter inhibens]